MRIRAIACEDAAAIDDVEHASSTIASANYQLGRTGCRWERSQFRWRYFRRFD